MLYKDICPGHEELVVRWDMVTVFHLCLILTSVTSEVFCFSEERRKDQAFFAETSFGLWMSVLTVKRAVRRHSNYIHSLGKEVKSNEETVISFSTCTCSGSLYVYSLRRKRRTD